MIFKMVLVALCGMLLVACGGSSSNEVVVNPDEIQRAAPISFDSLETKTFFEFSERITFPVPSNWIQRNTGSDITLVTLLEPIESEEDNYQENISINRISNSDFIEDPEAELLSSQKVMFGNKEATEYLYRKKVKNPFTSEYVWFEIASIILLDDDHSYVFQYTAEIRRFNRYLSVFREMAKRAVFASEITDDLNKESLADTYTVQAKVSSILGRTFIAYCKDNDFKYTEVMGVLFEEGVQISNFSIDTLDMSTSNRCNEISLDANNDGTNFVVSYIGERRGQASVEKRVLAKRISTSGQVLDSEAVLVSKQVSFGDVQAPSLVRVGSKLYVAWFESYIDFNNGIDDDPIQIVAADVSDILAVGKQFILSDFSADSRFSDTTLLDLKGYSNGETILISWARVNTNGAALENIHVMSYGLDGTEQFPSPLILEQRFLSKMSVIGFDSSYKIYTYNQGIKHQQLSSDGHLGEINSLLMDKQLMSHNHIDAYLDANEVHLSIASNQGVYYLKLTSDSNIILDEKSIPDFDLINRSVIDLNVIKSAIFPVENNPQIITTEGTGSLVQWEIN